MPTRGAYAPSEQVVAAEFFVNINNFEAALITGALTLPPVIEQGIRNALESGDSKKAKNIYNQYAQSQAAGGAMPPDDGDNDKNNKKYTTPDMDKSKFEKIKGSKAYKNKADGTVWEKDMLHKDHWEVYKNQKQWENGRRSFSVWSDGRFKGAIK